MKGQKLEVSFMAEKVAVEKKRFLAPLMFRLDDNESKGRLKTDKTAASQKWLECASIKALESIRSEERRIIIHDNGACQQDNKFNEIIKAYFHLT